MAGWGRGGDPAPSGFPALQAVRIETAVPSLAGTAPERPLSCAA